MKKFALVGTSCVGKTTLLNKLKRTLPKHFGDKEIIFIDEAARVYFTQVQTTEPFQFIHQKGIQDLAIKLEKEAHEKAPDIIISDRSVLDAMVYVASFADTTGKKALQQNAESWIATYTHFFLLDPKGVPYYTDEVRKESENQRQTFHETFVREFESLQIPYTLISGSLQNRLMTITNHIEQSLQR